MRAHCFQHVPFEGVGSIALWLQEHDYELTHTRFFEPTSLPQHDEIDFLIIMGGPMSVNDEQTYPWLIVEKAFVRQAIARGIPVLGVCLGAQVIASVLGASVYPNLVKEIGWFPIYSVASNTEPVFSFPASETVFHWHGETFDLPPSATRIASSEGCINQAFQFGETVIGLQFHLETTPESVRELVAHCRSELVPARYVQTEEDICSASPEQYTSIHGQMVKILDYLGRCNR